MNKKIVKVIGIIALVIIVVVLADYALGEILTGWNNPK